MQILVINGPNLNLLGRREPGVYGSMTLAEIEGEMVKAAQDLQVSLTFFQSNHEGALLDRIHAAAADDTAGIIINPGAFTHYAWAIHDALAAFEGPVVEVHLSNPNAREPWRHTSVIAPVATGSVMGFGQQGYDLAVRAVAAELNG